VRASPAAERAPGEERRMILHTIGFTNKSLREFIGQLREARVDGVVDVRLRNTSQLAGYAKRDDLAFILELVGIGYLEEPRLAPTDAILDAYHRDRDWDAYVPAFAALLAGRPLAEVLDAIAARFARPCLLCAEPEPSRCHRRLVAEAFARLRPGLEIRHLVLPAHEPGARRRPASGSPRQPRSASPRPRTGAGTGVRAAARRRKGDS
jgi:uncharacterized protein (DUF488 family)